MRLICSNSRACKLGSSDWPPINSFDGMSDWCCKACDYRSPAEVAPVTSGTNLPCTFAQRAGMECAVLITELELEVWEEHKEKLNGLGDKKNRKT